MLVDTSIWIRHFRLGDPDLQRLLAADAIVIHADVIGELACGTPPDRDRTIRMLEQLQTLPHATHPEIRQMIERDRLYGLGCGWTALALLAAVRLDGRARLWTADARLARLAERFDARWDPPAH